MKSELRENQGISAPLLALMAVATGLSVANCYYNQPLLGSMAKDFAVSDFSASRVATLTQIGYVAGVVFWQHYGWTGVVGVGVAFTAASLLANCCNSKTS